MFKSKRVGVCIATAVSLLVTQPVFAQNRGFYASLDASQLTLSGVGPGDMSSDLAGATIGYNFNENLALEIGYGIASTNVKLGFAEIVDLSSITGFVVGSYPISDQFSLQGRVGVQSKRYKLRNLAIAAPIDRPRPFDTTHPAIGVGATWRLTDNLEATGDYTVSGDNPFSSSSGSSKNISIGLRWRFGKR
jgi:Outer membrane protein beta-barrel domain